MTQTQDEQNVGTPVTSAAETTVNQPMDGEATVENAVVSETSNGEIQNLQES